MKLYVHLKIPPLKTGGQKMIGYFFINGFFEQILQGSFVFYGPIIVDAVK